MEILKLQPIFKDYIWGGQRLREDFGFQSDLPKLAEGWMLACHQAGMNTIDGGSYDGQPLEQVVESVGKEALCGTNAARFPYFPVLIKLIDAKDNLSIQLVDVEVLNEVSTNTIAYDTLTEEDNTMEVNTTKVKQSGEEGQVEVTYKVTKKNGKEVSREQVSSKVLKEAVTEIVVQGTAKLYASRSGETGTYKDVVYCQATAYTGGGLTATGSVPTYNPSGISTISVDPSVIPLGSLVYVDGYGKAIAADTGGAIQGNIIDVYVNSNNDAINWGRQYNVPVYIIAYPGEW